MTGGTSGGPLRGSFFGDFAVRNPHFGANRRRRSTPHKSTRWACIWTVNDEGLEELTTPCHGGVHSPSQIRLKTSQIPVNLSVYSLFTGADNENRI